MLPKDNRLTGFELFTYLKKKGQVTHFPDYKLITIPTTEFGNPKFGIIVSKKTSKKAVVRNKLKRKLRDEIRSKLKTNAYESNFVYIYIFN